MRILKQRTPRPFHGRNPGFHRRRAEQRRRQAHMAFQNSYAAMASWFAKAVYASSKPWLDEVLAHISQIDALESGRIEFVPALVVAFIAPRREDSADSETYEQAVRRQLDGHRASLLADFRKWKHSS